jgi:segregation and condensation protein A
VSPEAKAITFKLERFEGPLDLLLHLIRINKIDVFDIPIVAITQQYLEYIELMKEIDIDVGSEFMLMAATLIHIKTKTMLPAREDEEDPRLALVQRLLEHQQYRAAAWALEKREDAEALVWTSPASLARQYQEVDDELVEADIFQLISAFQRVLKSIGKDPAFAVEHQKFSIADKIAQLDLDLRVKPKMFFSEIIRHLSGKREVITVFLALLEMVRRHMISLMQQRLHGEIVIIHTPDEQVTMGEGEGSEK